MKNRIIISLLLGFILSSCGTTTRYASSSYEDAIYQRSGQSSYIVVNTEADLEISELRGKTQESNRVIINGKVIEPAYVDQQGNVEIEAKPDVTYIILNPGESFEERLTKFDQPQYNINITYNTLDFYNPWLLDYRYNRYAYMSRGWRTYWSWYYPHFSWNYRFYNPWYDYDPWFYHGWSHPALYSHWHLPIGYHWPYQYYYGHDPYYGYGYPYVYRSGVSNRDRFYGRRESSRHEVQSTGGSQAVSNSGGSYIRRDARVSQVRGESVYNGSQNLEQRYSESIYRRGTGVESAGVTGERSAVTRTNRTDRSVNTERSENVTRTTNTDRRENISRTANTGRSESVNRTSNTGSRQVTRTAPSRSAAQSSSQSSSEVRRTTAPNTTYRQSERARTIESSSGNQRSTGVSSQRSTSNFDRVSTSRSNTTTRSTSTPPPARTTTTTTSSSSSSTSSSSTSSSQSSSSGYRR